uniref:Uncharacterized protein n=1 Tax=Triticum urartu TaxID=4572 RepID=A0A8R7R1N7_TRIUA
MVYTYTKLAPSSTLQFLWNRARSYMVHPYKHVDAWIVHTSTGTNGFPRSYTCALTYLRMYVHPNPIHRAYMYIAAVWCSC